MTTRPLDSYSFTDSDVVHLQALLDSAEDGAPPEPGAPAAAGPVIDFDSVSLDLPDPAGGRGVGKDFPEALLERFLPVRLLGVGGMGSVYLARDHTLGRMVAVKVVQRASDPVHRERFLREAAGLARLKHPNLPICYDHGDTEDGPFMALEFLDGTPLHEVPLPFDPLPSMLQIADALEEIHAQGYVHRDVKPSNIILTGDGRAVLVDFGLLMHPDHSPLTRTGKVVGTMNYLAPEVLAYGSPGPASDWFSWGVTLFALLERRYPFEVRTLVTAARNGMPLRPEFRVLTPDDPCTLLLRRCLSLDPSHRPRTRAEVEDVLADAEAAEPTRPDLPTWPPPRPALEGDTSSASRPAARPRSSSSSYSKAVGASSLAASAHGPDWVERLLAPVTAFLDRLLSLVGLGDPGA